MDRENLGNEALARAAIEMYYDIERVSDIALDGPIREFNPTLENAARKPCKTLPRRRCMDCRETSRVTRIEKLQEIERLAATYLARVQINLRVSKHRREFFNAIRRAAFGEFVRKILRVIVRKLHNINDYLADQFEAGPSRSRWPES